MKFNVRVYGILIHENQIMLTKENRFGKSFTKFPGGGLEFGEGTKECLKREFQEELSIEVKIEKLLYVTDFFQESAFDSKQQIISIYYKVASANSNFNRKDIKVDSEVESIVWKPLESLSENDLTFPIDKYLVKNIL